MKIEEAIKQKQFTDPFHKAMVNLLYTSSWLTYKESGLFKKHGLTMPQYNVLRILKGQYPSAATVNLIIDRMLDKSSNASRIVEKLRSKGYIEREECKEDRRRVDVKITKAGIKKLEETSTEIQSFYKKHQHLTAEEASLLSDLLDKMRGEE